MKVKSVTRTHAEILCTSILRSYRRSEDLETFINHLCAGDAENSVLMSFAKACAMDVERLEKRIEVLEEKLKEIF